MHAWLLVDPSGKLKHRREPVCAADDRRLSPAVKNLVACQSATACTVQGVPNLIQKQDQITGHFLVDTSASLSLLPHKSNTPCSGLPLVSTSGLPIRSWGFQQHTVKFGPQAFTFNVARPILGLIFYAHTASMSLLLSALCVLRPVAGLESRPSLSPPPYPLHLVRSAQKYCRKYLQIFKSC